MLVAWTIMGTFGFMWIEGWSWEEALFMALITVSTVGYGEVHPLSTVGRLFASFLIIGGLGTALYTMTRVGQVILEGELFGELGKRRMQKELAELKDHFILCGFGRFSRSVADDMEHSGYPFCIIESSSENEESLRDLGYLYLLADATSDEALIGAGVERARAVLALLPSDADNLYITVTAKALNPTVRIIARTADESGETKLRRAGAHEVFSPYKLASHRIVQAATAPTVLRFMDHIADRTTLEMNLGEARVGDGSGLVGQKLGDAHLRSTYDVTVVALKKSDGTMVFNPRSGEQIHAGDVLVVIGHHEALGKMKKALEA
jgi:voltage-gated potassium channel